MDSSGSPIAHAVGADDLPEVARLLDHDGPFVTVQLVTDADIDNAAQRSMQHWRNVRDTLEAEGVDVATVDAIEAEVPDLHHEGSGSLIVATAGEVVLSLALPEVPAGDGATVAALPPLAPLVAWRQANVPYVLVLADRVGADITVVGPTGDSTTTTAGSNDPRNPIHRKTHPGGWSQRRYQERAENSWEANARAVASRVRDAAALVDPQAILVAGDVRAITLLREELDPRLTPRITEIAGARGDGGRGDDQLRDVRRLLNTVVADRTVALLERFREEKGRDERATDGLAATIEALNAAQVDVLLVHEAPEDDRQAWYARGQALVATDQATLASYGVTEPRQGRLVDALIHAAFQGGARVRIVPSTVAEDGVGALLRFAG